MTWRNPPRTVQAMRSQLIRVRRLWRDGSAPCQVSDLNIAQIRWPRTALIRAPRLISHGSNYLDTIAGRADCEMGGR